MSLLPTVHLIRRSTGDLLSVRAPSITGPAIGKNKKLSHGTGIPITNKSSGFESSGFESRPSLTPSTLLVTFLHTPCNFGVKI